jgi:hypothetical protein
MKYIITFYIMLLIIVWSLGGFALQTNGVNYVVVPYDSREVAVECTNGAQPLITQTAENMHVVTVKCIDQN